MRVCEVDGCPSKHYCRGFCIKHYARFMKHGDPNIVKSKKILGECKVESCECELYCGGYCTKHYQRFRKYGDPLMGVRIHEVPEFCTIDGCDEVYHGNGFCEKHYQKNYRNSKKGREVRKIHHLRRRLMKNGAPINDLSKKDWEDCLHHFDNSCAYCGNGNRTLDREHVVAISQGGSNTKSNIVPSCGSCNYSKGTEDMLTWYRRKPFYSQDKEIKILKWNGHDLDKGTFQTKLF